MKQITYEQLEDCQTRIYNALQLGNRKDKEDAFGYAWLHIPDLKEELDCKWEDNIDMYIDHDNSIVPSLSQVKVLVLDINLHFCIDIINKRMRINFSSPISPNAVQILFFSPEPLQQETVLYEEKDEDGDERKLKFSDFLSVLSYADKFVKMSFGSDKDKCNNSLIALKTVDLAINHKPVNKPLNKSLHLVNDVLTEFAKALSKDKETKRTASGISLLVDLAIDFLIRG